ncbi:MAG TPA: MOSC domain-containing protein [Planctomycetota bacterium]|nr:MOSC domain-containing protein [Planctomycetota bacterium]
MKIKSIQAGLPKVYVELMGDGSQEKKRRTAIFKEPVAGRVRATALGLDGDGQADRRFHGGEDKAINAYCFVHYARWAREFGEAALPPGAFGENFTLDDTNEESVCIGDVFDAGSARIQISQPRQPCGTLAWRWKRVDLPHLINAHGSSGWYFRVLKEGEFEAGAELKLIERLFPRWTVTAANDVMVHHKGGASAARELAELPPLSESWKEALLRRVKET